MHNARAAGRGVRLFPMIPASRCKEIEARVLLQTPARKVRTCFCRSLPPLRAKHVVAARRLLSTRCKRRETVVGVAIYGAKLFIEDMDAEKALTKDKIFQVIAIKSNLSLFWNQYQDREAKYIFVCKKVLDSFRPFWHLYPKGSDVNGLARLLWLAARSAV